MSGFLQMPTARLAVHQAQGSDLMTENPRVTGERGNPFSGNEKWARFPFQHAAPLVSPVFSPKELKSLWKDQRRSRSGVVGLNPARCSALFESLT